MEKSKATKYDIAVVVGDFLFNTHRFLKAIDFYKEAQTLINENQVQNLPNRKHEIVLLYLRLARAFNSTKKFKEALANYEEVLNVAGGDIRTREAQVEAYRAIRAVYICLGRHVQVIFYERKLLEIAKETGDKQAELRAHETIGQAYYQLDQQDKSIESHNEALRISRQIGDREGESRALFFLGSGYKVLAQYAKAISHLGKALQIQRDVGNRKEEARSYQQLGNVYHEFGAFDKALACHNKSLEMVTTLGDRTGQGVCYNNIGTTYVTIGRYDEALEYFLKTLEIMTNFGTRAQEGRAHYSLGLCYCQLGKFHKSIEHHEKALEILEESGDRFGQGRSCASLGTVYSEIGHYEKAIEYLKRALKIAKETGDRKAMSNAYFVLGEVYFLLDPQSGKGETCVKKALDISKESGDKQQMANNYITLASMYSQTGQYKESLENHKCAIEIMKEIGDRHGEAHASSCLAQVCIALGKFTEGKKHLKKALCITREIGSKGMEYSILCSLGICNAHDGEFKKAREHLYESVSCVERDRELLRDEHKLSLDNKTFYNYTALYTLLVTQGNVDEALCTAERGRARALVDLMSKKYGIRLRRPHSDELPVNKIRNLPTQNQSTIIFVAVARENIYFWVIEEGGKIRFKLSNCKSRDESVVNLFKLPREQLLRFWLDGRGGQCEDRSLSAYYKVQSSAVENKGEVSGQRLVEEKDDQSEGKTESQESGLHLLYRRMFAPVADHIQSQNIIIVPEGDMWMVPFPALKDANGKFVSETYRIRLVPSLTVLNLIQASPDGYHKTTGALIVGDPDVHPITKLSLLPEARKEAQEIAELLGVRAIVGRQATKEEVLRGIQDVSLIHIAAHGDAERGEIALAVNRSSRQVPRKEDFMLTMEDVAKVGVRAKLVVLSCCHSGRGEIMKSEGVVGIARAFLASGARSVLVSLWVLDDKSTKEFMIRFYGHLVRDKLSASQAVHQSIKWMRESADYSGVGHWAPFVLIGDNVKLNL